MNDYLWIVFVVVVAALLLLRRRGQISIEEARTYLDKGAVLLDVRSSQEFASGALEGAINVPLNGVTRGVSERYPDKDTVLLCHCASGARSAAAVSQLRAAGYVNARNLGGFGRAEKALR